ncbi:MAG TPA: histidine phosphatase family protein [Ktedonobacterales bacterium]|nr:histidine phosphatase family protein [Ktedonobacterales bacterium]
MSSTRLHFIRHGQAYSNIPHDGKVVSGMKGDKGLTPHGISQVERLRDRLLATNELAADVVLASTLPRAWQSAEILTPVWETPIIPDDDLHELRPGEADGMLRELARERYGYGDFAESPYQPKSPGGETWGAFMLRVGTMLDRVTREYEGKTIVLITSGGVIHAAFLIFFGMHTLVPPGVWFATDNTSITTWEQRPWRNLPSVWTLLRYNDTSHLRNHYERIEEHL